MRKLGRMSVVLAAVLVMGGVLRAQDKSKSDESKLPARTIKLTVVFAEAAGDKKIVNLPYTMVVKTRGSSEGGGDSWGKVRVGDRVPIAAGENGNLTYIDVGTNIDAQVVPSEESEYRVNMNLERSSIDDRVSGQDGSTTEASKGGCRSSANPTIRQFKQQLNLVMKDGQTIQSVQAADPLDGRLLTITVTMNVVK